MLYDHPRRSGMYPPNKVSKLTYRSLLQRGGVRRFIFHPADSGETNLEKLRLMNDLMYDSIGSTSRASGAGMSEITIRNLEGEY